MDHKNKNIVDKWIYTNSSFEKISNYDDDIFLEGNKLCDYAFSNPQLSWNMIEYIVENYEDRIILSNLAAGPIETLLSAHGSDYIDQVEDYAKANERFRWTLGGVWQCLMPDNVWHRILSLTEDVRDHRDQ